MRRSLGVLFWAINAVALLVMGYGILGYSLPFRPRIPWPTYLSWEATSLALGLILLAGASLIILVLLRTQFRTETVRSTAKSSMARGRIVD